jgi:hypothetical protein
VDPRRVIDRAMKRFERISIRDGQFSPTLFRGASPAPWIAAKSPADSARYEHATRSVERIAEKKRRRRFRMAAEMMRFG